MFDSMDNIRPAPIGPSPPARGPGRDDRNKNHPGSRPPARPDPDGEENPDNTGEDAGGTGETEESPDSLQGRIIDIRV